MEFENADNRNAGLRDLSFPIMHGHRHVNDDKVTKRATLVFLTPLTFN
jgi:hypothetical protein